MQTQHEPMIVKIKTHTATYIGANRVDSLSTIGGQRTRSWVRTLKESIARKCNSPHNDIVRKVEIELCP